MNKEVAATFSDDCTFEPRKAIDNDPNFGVLQDSYWIIRGCYFDGTEEQPPTIIRNIKESGERHG